MKHGTIRILALSLLTIFVPRTGSMAQTPTIVPKLDFNQLNGTWYEIARYPNKREAKRCARNARMLVAPGDKNNHLQIVYACKTRAGYADARNVDAKAADKLGDGRLKLGTWPFYRKFWVLAMAPDAGWSLIGNPNRKDLWIYSKTASLSPAVLAQIEAKMVEEGFTVGKLTMTAQDLPAAE